MNKQNIELDVLVNQRPVRQFGHAGKTFIEAKVGSEYSLRIRNNNSYRVLAVVSVDGVDVISGKEASYNGSGYIIEAYSSVDIKGYRKDLESVGAFKFTKKKKSYAKEVSGSTQNVGVISLAVFSEKIKPQPVTTVHHYHPVYTDSWLVRPYRPYPTWEWPSYTTYDSHNVNSVDKNYTTTTYSCNASNLAGGTRLTSYNAGEETKSPLRRSGARGCSASLDSIPTASAAPDFTVGSTWGQQVQHKVVNVEFERASTTPMVTMDIYYDSREQLEEIGIDFAKQPKVALPRGFPAGFATPPSNWNG